DDNVADLLTKAFDGPRFEYLVVHIGMVVNTAASSMDSADGSVFMLVGILLLVDSFLLIGFVYAVNTSIYAAELVCAGSIMLTVPPSYCRDVVVVGNIIQTVQAGLRQAYECIASAPM
ncbi:hypothetical protein Tco_0849352, partial [Tanacetum coccineum]